MRIGLISDTHGLIRPEAVKFLLGCQHIVHAGDICDAKTLEKLARIAPVTAVRGNNDKGFWAQALEDSEWLQFDGATIYVIHDLAQMDIEPKAAGVSVVVSGHSHQPQFEEREGVLYVNPGSAGPRRFKLPVSIGEIIILGNKVTARTLELPT